MSRNREITCDNGLSYPSSLRANIIGTTKYLREFENIVSFGFTKLIDGYNISANAENVVSSILIDVPYDKEQINQVFTVPWTTIHIPCSSRLLNLTKSFFHKGFYPCDKGFGICFYEESSKKPKKDFIYAIYCPIKLNLVTINTTYFAGLDNVNEICNEYWKLILFAVEKLRDSHYLIDAYLKKREEFETDLQFSVGDSIVTYKIDKIVKVDNLLESKKEEIKNEAKVMITSHQRETDRIITELRKEFDKKISDLRASKITMDDLLAMNKGIITALPEIKMLAFSVPADFRFKVFCDDSRYHIIPTSLRKRIMGWWTLYYDLNDLWKLYAISLRKFPPRITSDTKYGISTYHSNGSSSGIAKICRGEFSSINKPPTVELADSFNAMFEIINMDSPLNRDPAELTELSTHISKVITGKLNPYIPTAEDIEGLTLAKKYGIKLPNPDEETATVASTIEDNEGEPENENDHW